MQKFCKAAHSDDDEEQGEFREKSPKQGFTRIIPVRQYNFYIYSAIGAPENYTEMIHTIRTAEAHDQIFIHLNSEGGHLDTGIAIISAIAESQATITTVLDSTACSMAAILFLAGHQYIVHDCSMLMFHTFSGGFYGKSSDLDKQVQAYKRQYSMLVKKICSRFLTHEEIRRIDNGEEMWFASDIIGKRMKTLEKELIDEAAGKLPKPVKAKRTSKSATTHEDSTAE